MGERSVKTHGEGYASGVGAKIARGVGRMTGATLGGEVREFAEVYGEVLLGLHEDVRTVEGELSQLSVAGQALNERLAVLEAKVARDDVASDRRLAYLTLLFAVLAFIVSVGGVAWAMLSQR